jgi:hypothetical protein
VWRFQTSTPVIDNLNPVVDEAHKLLFTKLLNMKKIILITFFAFFGGMAFAQTSPEAYLKKIPALSKDTCNATKEAVGEFKDQVGALNSLLADDISARKEKLDAAMENSEDAFREGAAKQMAQQYGISQEDMEKMKNGKNLSAAEKQAMANKMMMQQTNISMGEAKNLSKMSEAGKKAWAEAYATEAMAAAQANQGKQPAQNPGQTIAELVQAQNAIVQKISFSEQQIMAKYAQLENDPTGKIMLTKIGSWKSQWGAMGGVDYGQGPKMDSLMLLIHKEQIRYCRKFTPQLWQILNEHLAFVQSSIPDYRNLEEITGQILKAQTGVASPVRGSDIECLKAIHNFLDKFAGAYDYKLYYAGDQ